MNCRTFNKIRSIVDDMHLVNVTNVVQYNIAHKLGMTNSCITISFEYSDINVVCVSEIL